MIIYLILSLVTALIGASPALLVRRYTGYAILATVYFFIFWLIYYLSNPSLEYSLGGGVLWCTLFVTVVSALIFNRREDEYDTNFIVAIPPGVLLIIGIICAASGWGAFNSSNYSSLIGNIGAQGKTLKHWTQQNQELSPTHIRLVPEEHAISIARTSLNQNSDDAGNIVGSQFHVDENHATLQKVKNELFYVIPLDYNGWGVWNNTRGAPGFVLVNAEDQHTIPKYYNGFAMQYTPGAYFDKNLERYIYRNGYSTKILKDFSFEVDDDLKPWWVVTVCHHTIGAYDGLVVDGVVVVNPEDGKITYYAKDSVPVWIDRVIPMDIVNDNIGYWGKYLKGYWNRTAVGASANIRSPESTLLNYGSDGTCWYVTPVTSTSGSKDSKGKSIESMTDLIYTNSRTGESHCYSLAGQTEEQITQTVDATVGYQHLHAAAIVYENVSDRLTALAPILAEDHSIRGLALVDPETKTISYDADPLTALMKYQNSLGSLSSAIGVDIATNETEYKGIVDRVNQSSTSSGSTYYIYIKKLKHIFSVPQTWEKIRATNPGDTVYIKYLESKMSTIDVLSFDNLNIQLEHSENQKDVFDRSEKRHSDERTEQTRGSVIKTIKNGDIDPKVLDSIAKKLGSKK